MLPPRGATSTFLPPSAPNCRKTAALPLSLADTFRSTPPARGCDLSSPTQVVSASRAGPDSNPYPTRKVGNDNDARHDRAADTARHNRPDRSQFGPASRHPTPRELDGADIIIIPGTKNTISDLTYLRKSGFDKKITSITKSNNKVMLIGICGGYQILGNKIKDLRNIESNVKEAKGLGFLPVETTLEKANKKAKKR